MAGSVKMNYKVFGIPLLGLLIGGGLLLGVGWAGFQMYLVSQYKPVLLETPDKVVVDIPAGASTALIGELLEEAGIIRSQRAFVNFCRQEDIMQSLQAGVYAFSPSQSTQEIAARIAAGQVDRTRLTVPEGYTVQQVGELLAGKGLADAEQWRSALSGFYQSYAFLPPGSGAERFEGYLFPDTYFIGLNATTRDIVVMMLAQLKNVWEQENFAAAAAARNMSMHEVLTVASMLEREAMRTEEMPRIAGVIYNRLEAGMLLQIDATVLFALKEHKPVVTLRDLTVDSPYNTYLYPGLPPGPIAAPGQAAIAAALFPETHDYLYYMAVGDGSHEFNRTYTAHLEAQKRYESRY
jgi:UPF0755 protein